MICEITNKRSFYVDDGRGMENLFDSGVPVLATGSFKLCDLLRTFLWNKHKLHCSQHAQTDANCPYVLLLHGQKTGSKPSKAKVELARTAALAMAVGLESHYLFCLESL